MIQMEVRSERVSIITPKDIVQTVDTEQSV
nr:MAG TPA: hypothetical protein [Caudoviricetes sp.]DAR88434.1 MAG TPA: hypothetical protein [Bacteriophage sp.]